MKYVSLLLILIAQATWAQKSKTTAAEVYFPGPDSEWKKKTPAEAGFDADRLKAAIDYCISQESQNPRNLEQSHYQSFGREPFGGGIGPFKD